MNKLKVLWWKLKVNKLNTKKLNINKIFTNINEKLKIKQKIKSIKNKWEKLNTPNKVAVTILCLIPLFFVAGTLGRYAYIEVRDFYLASKNFYFNSDKLGERIQRYQVDNWSGAEDYQILFNMDSYDNNKKYSTSDIEYNVTFRCSTNVTCDISGDYGTILASKHTDQFTITITPHTAFSDGDEAWLEVIANSTSPYTKTLSGRFVIKVGKMGLSYQIDDKANRPYFDLSVTNTLDYYLVKQVFDSYQVNDRLDVSTYLNLTEENKAKCQSALITLAFDPNVAVLDMTNENYLNSTNSSTRVIGGYNYVDSITYKVDALSSASVRFYKKDTTQDYTYPFDNRASIVTVTYN